jgi:hypothetical protein
MRAEQRWSPERGKFSIEFLIEWIARRRTSEMRGDSIGERRRELSLMRRARMTAAEESSQERKDFLSAAKCEERTRARPGKEGRDHGPESDRQEFDQSKKSSGQGNPSSASSEERKATQRLLPLGSH